MPKPVRARTWRPPLSRPAGGPDASEAGRRVARAGRAAIRRQHPSSLRPRRGRSLPWCGEFTFRTPTRHRATNQQTRRILIPGDGAAGDQGLRIGLSARRWRLRATRGLSRLNDSLALWSQAYMLSVTGRSHRPRSAWPTRARLAFLAVTHRYNGTLSLARTISDLPNRCHYSLGCSLSPGRIDHRVLSSGVRATGKATLVPSAG